MAEDRWTGRRFIVRNHTLSGDPIIEGLATVKSVKRHNTELGMIFAVVRFDGDDAPDETYLRWLRKEDQLLTKEPWIERHSVNCMVCGRLFDERESVGTTVDGGDLCPDHYEDR